MGGIEFTGGLIAASCIVLILLASAIHGVIAGGLRVAWSMGCIIIAIVLSVFVNIYVSAFFNEQLHADQQIEKAVMKYMENQNLEELNNAGSKEQEAYIKSLNIPAFWKRSLIKNNTVDGYMRMMTNVFTVYIARAIAGFSVKTLAFILTFILVDLILRGITALFSIVEKIPILKQMNKMVGAGIGLVRGLVVISLLMVFITFVSNYGWGQSLAVQILSNPISAFFYKYNLLPVIFTAIF